MYSGFVLPEHRLSLRKIIKEKSLRQIFSEDWLNETLKIPPDLPIADVHPVYRYLANPNEYNLFINGLELLFNEKRYSVIKAIKNNRDSAHVKAIVRNIQTFAVLRSYYSTVRWEPKSAKTNKVPDMLCECNDRKIFIEVFCVNNSEEAALLDKIIAQLHAAVNRLSDNPFVIGADLKGSLSVSEIDKIIIFLRKTIRVNRNIAPPFNRIYKSSTGSMIFKFHSPNKSKKGFWGYHSTGVHIRKDIDRVKSKIMDKLDELQFHAKDEINAFCIFLEDFMMDNNDVIDAILGKKAVVFSTSGTDSRWTRSGDGIISNKKYSKILLEWIDFIVVTSHPSLLENRKKVVILRNEERDRVSEKGVEELFKMK